MDTTKKETLFLYLVQAANLLVPLVVFPHIAKSLGAIGFGKFGYIQAIIMLGTFCVDFGYDYFGAHLISRYRRKAKARSIVYANIQLAKIILACCVMALGGVLLLCNVVADDEALALALGLPSIISSILVPIWLFQGMQQLSKMVVITVFIKILFMWMTWLVVSDKEDLVLAIIFQVYSSVISGVIVTILAYRYKMFDIQYIAPSLRRMLEFFKGASHIFSGSIMTLGFTYGNPLLLKCLIGDVAVGQYVAAEKIVSVLRQAFSPLVQGKFSYICTLYENGGENNEINYIIKNTMLLMLFLVLAAFFGTIFLSDIIFPLVLGDDYSIKDTLILLIASQMLVAISMVQVAFIIIPSGWQLMLKRIYAIAFFCHMLYVIPLVIIMQVNGMALSMIMTEAIVVLVTFAFISNKNKLNRQQ